ncbi:unnamed protein product [Vitrella brassicaformis CCMP3155]|uniref:Uncharacterized protein n=1 Tax=Vitrella brassicaformis (strain CCMP3155) TaxID=1169540 RepID=A0A0G4G0T0_VITBC|nr:unnamed protein product [Vitrella brassicaformis CCMP3155]|mmetsp:Transcript_9374/g.27006  ORF Transcript_9374/g.27006 Transcript_9374/m.27006 type:complete len:654 (-) Transcript_9374:164-2125(-)|eukprot:CEM21475.1 unnamed protein product [Vitrella brassicaformis CCMP3155]
MDLEDTPKKSPRAGDSPKATGSCESAAGRMTFSTSSTRDSVASSPKGQQVRIDRSCLEGLEGPLVGRLGSLISTREAAPLSGVSKELYGKVNDGTYGIWRWLVIRDGENIWQDLGAMKYSSKDIKAESRKRKAEYLKARLRKIKVCHVSTSHGDAVTFIAECLEASKGTLTHMTLVGPDQTFSVCRSRPDPVVFERLTSISVSSPTWMLLMWTYKWELPKVTVLSLGPVSRHTSVSTVSLSHILQTCPLLQELRAKELVLYDTDYWKNVCLNGLSKCPQLRVITGLCVKFFDFAPLRYLIEALDPHWSRHDMKGVPKKIQIRYCMQIGTDFGKEVLTRSKGPNPISMPDFIAWAGRLGCHIDWTPWFMEDTLYDVSLECSNKVPTAPPAVRGPIADVVRTLTNKSHAVQLSIGGTALDVSWKDKLVFPRAKNLRMYQFGESIPVAEAIKSIPDWLIETEEDGSNAHMPAMETFFGTIGFIFSHQTSHRPSADLPAAPNKLSQLIGGFRRLRAVLLVSSSLNTILDFVSYMKAPHVDEVECELAAHVTELPETLPTDKVFPSVQRFGLRSFRAISRSCALSCARLIAAIAAAEATFEVWIEQNEFQDGPRDVGMRALCYECIEVVQGVYDVTHTRSSPNIGIRLKRKKPTDEMK